MSAEPESHHRRGDHAESRQWHDDHAETWHFVMGLRIPPRALQLVAIISDNPNNRRESIVYFYLTVMCAPITAQMLQQSKALRAWCNDAKLDIGRDDEAFTWSADGTFNSVASSKCVLWTHSSLEQVVMPKSNAPKAVRTLGRKLARTLRSCCDGMGEIELLFEIKGNPWQEQHPATIGYTETVGALKYIVEACQGQLMLGQLDNQIASYHYSTRNPHVSVLDLAMLQLFGNLRFYTYKGADQPTKDYTLTTVFFGKQDQIIQNHVRTKFWHELDIDTFLRYTHGSQYKALLTTPGAMPDILQKHCGVKAKRSSGRKSPDKRRIKHISRKMSKLSLQ